MDSGAPSPSPRQVGLTTLPRSLPPWLADPASAVIEGGWDGTDPAFPGRRRFLTALSEVEPRLLGSLKAEMLPLYCEAMQHERRFILEHPDLRYTRHGVREWKELNDRLLLWADRWHLAFLWIGEALLSLVHAWNEDLIAGQNPRATWALPTRVYTMTQESEFAFRHAGWSVGEDRREKAAAVIRAAFETELRVHLDRLEQLSKDRGYRPAHRSRARHGNSEIADPDRHYRWLARWQLGLASQATLAREAGVDRSTVERALRRVAEEIGITRRTEKAARVQRQRTQRRGPRR